MPIVDPAHTPTHGPRCSFCGRSATDTERLVSGPDVYICSECIQQAATLVDAQAEPQDGEVDRENELYAPTGHDYCLAFAALHALSAPIYDMILQLGRSPEQALDMLAEELRYEHCLQKRCGEVLDTGTTVYHAVDALVAVSLDVNERLN